MPDFEFEFNQQDKDLIVTQESETLSIDDYIRLTIYPLEAITNIVSLPDIARGVRGRAVFFSTLSNTNFSVNVTPFKIGDNSFEGSRFPWRVIFPPVKYRAFLAEQVQSIPIAETLDLLISFRWNQHPFPKTMTGIKGLNSLIIWSIYFHEKTS